MCLGTTRTVITNIQDLCVAHSALGVTPGSIAKAMAAALGMDCRLDCADFHLVIEGLPTTEQVLDAFVTCLESH